MKKQDRYDSLIKYYAGKNGLDWLLVKAQIRAESNFDPDAESWVKATGLAQFMRATWQEWGDNTPGIQKFKRVFSRKNPEHAIRSMCAYITWLYIFADKRIIIYARHNVRVDRDQVMFACYNWGIGKMQKHFKNYGHINTLKLPKETLNYINRINNYKMEYKNNGN